MEYPFAGRNLFQEPENYFYADCSDDGFLDAWRENRQRMLEALKTRRGQLAGSGRPVGSSARETPEGDVDLRSYLAALASELRLGTTGVEEATHRLRPYLVKYEIRKQLRSRYDAAHQPVEGAPEAGLDAYLAFAECLHVIAREAGSLQHLSTLLKLCDALVSLPATEYRPEQAARMVAILEEERTLVSDLRGRSWND